VRDRSECTAVIGLPCTVRPASGAATRTGLPCRWRSSHSGAILVPGMPWARRSGPCGSPQHGPAGWWQASCANWVASRSGKALTSPPPAIPWAKRPGTTAGFAGEVVRRSRRRWRPRPDHAIGALRLHHGNLRGARRSFLGTVQGSGLQNRPHSAPMTRGSCPQSIRSSPIKSAPRQPASPACRVQKARLPRAARVSGCSGQ
jgi:hypothetical protein